MTQQSWLDITTSLFKCNADNNGRSRTFRQILFSDFAIEHEWYYNKEGWINGSSNDLDTIIKIRSTQIDKAVAKQTLQCYTPSAYYQCKKKGAEIIVHHNPILQLDFDKLEKYDLDEVKAAIFDLPFVCCISKSVSGNGLFALILIEEPEKLKDYAIHCFHAFEHYGFIADTTKGRNYSDLRYVSYDDRLLYREYPTPLKVTNFYKEPAREIKPFQFNGSADGLIKWAVREIQNAESGNRSNIVNKVCYTLGGYGKGLDEVINAINNSAQFTGEQNEFIDKARISFTTGQLKPIAA